jgi:hypothetical protein
VKRYPRHIETAWAVWETFRRLGYSSDDLWVGTRATLLLDGSRAEAFFVILRRQEMKEESDWFKVCVGVVDAGSDAENRQLWEEWCEKMNAGELTDEQLQAIYRREIPNAATVAGLVTALKSQHLPVPKLDS